MPEEEEEDAHRRRRPLQGRRHLAAQAALEVMMLRGREREQEAVGARGAAGLLYKGEAAKEAFVAAGGPEALLEVLGAPGTPLEVLAPVCTTLLNLSSYLPVQVRSSVVVVVVGSP